MLAGVLVVAAALLAPRPAFAQQALWPAISGANILGAPRPLPLDQALKRFYERERRLFQANPLLDTAEMILRRYAANFRRADIDGDGIVSAVEFASAPEIRF